MAARVFTALAAILLVGAVALAVLAPRGMTLEQGLLALDQGVLASLRSAITRPSWLWPRVVTPLLVRPAWLLPLEVAIVCAGGAMTLNWLRMPRQRQRRS